MICSNMTDESEITRGISLVVIRKGRKNVSQNVEAPSQKHVTRKRLSNLGNTGGTTKE